MYFHFSVLSCWRVCIACTRHIFLIHSPNNRKLLFSNYLPSQTEPLYVSPYGPIKECLCNICPEWGHWSQETCWLLFHWIFPRSPSRMLCDLQSHRRTWKSLFSHILTNTYYYYSPYLLVILMYMKCISFNLHFLVY